jgi:DNA-binding transcriptional regulator YiaG
MAPEEIRLVRERLQMSQGEFARELGLSHRGSVSRLESGSRKAGGSVLVLLRQLAERAKIKRGK